VKKGNNQLVGTKSQNNNQWRYSSNNQLVGTKTVTFGGKDKIGNYYSPVTTIA